MSSNETALLASAIRALFRVMNRYVGNLPPMSGVFGLPAPVVRNLGCLSVIGMTSRLLPIPRSHIQSLARLAYLGGGGLAREGRPGRPAELRSPEGLRIAQLEVSFSSSDYALRIGRFPVRPAANQTDPLPSLTATASKSLMFGPPVNTFPVLWHQVRRW
jgi:hypothetical protein